MDFHSISIDFEGIGNKNSMDLKRNLNLISTDVEWKFARSFLHGILI